MAEGRRLADLAYRKGAHTRAGKKSDKLVAKI